jgi:hypothetical protein
MNQIAIFAKAPDTKRTKLGGYVLSAHAKRRMIERSIAAEDVASVFKSQTTYCEVNSAGIAHYRASVRGRRIRVTVSELANVILTVAAATPFDRAAAGVTLQHGS